MKRNLSQVALWAGLLLISVSSDAREEFNKPKNPHKNSFKTEAGDCVASIAQFDMDINNVRTRLLTGGDAWWDVSSLPKYEVPKGSDLHAIFAGSIWITGLDDGNNLKCAAVRYRQNGNDFWPGPLTSAGSTDKAVCSQYDRHFNVYGRDIATAQSAYLQKGSATTLGDIPRGLLSWPGKGNQYLATDPTLVGQTFNISENLAPFKDVDGDDIYDPVKGDYPVIPCRGGDPVAYGDQMVFWVFNDAGNIHTESNGQAIGVQVNALGFAFQTTDEIDNMTFYKYEITNKSTNKLNQTYISQWVDPDLGCFNNDKIGCDTTRSLGICYNGTSPDPDCQQENGYGSQLPIVGFDFFEGPISDSGQQLGLTSFVYFTNGAVFSQQDPGSAAQYRNYQTGFWNDGTPFQYGGTGYNSGGPPTKFIFPGNPSDPSSWTECQPEVASVLQPADRRFVQTSGPFTLLPGVAQYVTVGCVFVRPSGSGVGLCPNFNTTIGPADDKAQQLFNTCFKLLDGPEAPTLKIRELNKEVIINLVNYPGSNNYGEGYDQVDGATAQAVNQLPGKGDSTFTFEGYKVYQLSRSDVSATDLGDKDKARLLAQVDVKNGITRIINFKKDATLGLFIPTLEVDGNDEGVTNSFSITKTLFPELQNSNEFLINHRTYYYTAVAYAYNNYRQFDQANPQTGGQLLPYLQGRGNFKVYSAIPHIPDPRNEGTILNSAWNDGVEVKRIEGQGNGGNSLFLTPETIEKIISSGTYAFADTLTYKKGFDPIGFHVTDPVSLIEADFELQFKDTVTNNIGTTTSWYLRDLTNGDTIFSERNLDRPYEQQIILNKGGERVDYGFSIKLGTPAKRYTLPANYPSQGYKQRAIYDPLPAESSITYEVPTQQWLSFMKDEGVNSPSNWIRSGSTAASTQSQGGGGTANPIAGVYDAAWYYTDPVPPTEPSEFIYSDSFGHFGSMLNGTWAPYCLTANYASKASTATIPYVYGPGFKWRNYGGSPIPPPHNTLDRLASVDIIITPDRSKWSRCVVFETGEDESINLGNDIYSRTISNAQVQNRGALKGQIRMAYSRIFDSNGNLVEIPDKSDTGRSYFPGYAINMETGERLNIAFGESSDQGDQNGRDMLWNPSGNLYSPLFQPYFGGKHFIYVMDTKYDEGYAAQQLLLRTYDSIVSTQLVLPRTLYPLYQSLMWTSVPYLSAGYSFQADDNGQKYIPPANVTIRLRVEKPYDRFATSSSSGDNATLPRYQFSTKGIGATEKNPEQAKSALDIIRIVPNPYLAYSNYETDQNSNLVKITNLPNVCNITIFSLDGMIIRKLSRAIGSDPVSNKRIEISDGATTNEVNIDNTVTWDLKNDKGVPISSGIYLVHVEAPGIGQRTLKWFGAVRPADTSNF